jgi:hypothetical protein
MNVLRLRARTVTVYVGETLGGVSRERRLSLVQVKRFFSDASAAAGVSWSPGGSARRIGPELPGPGLAEPMGARPSLPLAFREDDHGLRGRIGPQELPRQRRRQLRHLEGPRIVGLQRDRQLVDQTGLLANLPLVVGGRVP